jgi:hypothetical protein
MIYFCRISTFIFLWVASFKVTAQDVSINILNKPVSVSQGATNGRVTIDICNNDGGNAVTPLRKIRPLLKLPTDLIGFSVTIVSSQGWNVISNNGYEVEFENTGSIAPGQCSQIILGYTGVSLGGPSTVIGTIGFDGAPTPGNVTTNDQSTTSIRVITIPLNTNPPPVITASANTLVSGNSATDLAPTGGSGSYIFSNGSADATCALPQGLSQLPPESNLTINPDGSYSFISPYGLGTYYFCVKVCDTSSPTPQCKVIGYTLNTTTLVCTANAGVLN